LQPLPLSAVFDERHDMDPAELIRAGEALVRPCVYLRETGSDLAAIWTDGSGPGLTFDSAWLPFPGWPRQGLFSLNEAYDGRAHLTFAAGESLAAQAAGRKLYATPGSSLPPVDALFLFGPEHVQAWLRELGWPPEAGYNDNFPQRSIVEAYEERYQQELPFYSGGAHAVLGGWHFPWPDDDWRELVSCQLLAWTFADGEPWLEGWAGDGRFWAKARST
jgi:hypothetical protein